jgi:hypothetical protein
MATVAINGLGRIGRAAFKIILATPELDRRAINDLSPPDDLAYLMNYDSVYGRYEERVTAQPDGLSVDGMGYTSQLVREAARIGKVMSIGVLHVKTQVSGAKMESRSRPPPTRVRQSYQADINGGSDEHTRYPSRRAEDHRPDRGHE